MNGIDKTGKKIRKQFEIDFVCNKGSKRYYIQSAFALLDEKKMEKEQRSLINTGDGFKKIIITKDALAPIQAACYAKTAGFDMIEVHGHAGYLIDQFFSSDINKRTDEYGGGIRGRFRVAEEIVKGIKEATGGTMTVDLRLSVDHKVNGKRDLQEGIELYKLAEEAGYDAVHVDAGRYEAVPWIFPPAYLGEACMKDLAAAIRKEVNIPVISVGTYGTPENAEKALEEGSADFIALGRELIADPQWANKARRGCRDNIRPCIQCNERCVGRLFSGMSINCSVNPQAARETRLQVTPAEEKRNVVVIGGGPAGIEAAVIASRRGHNVTLLEKNEDVGGQLKLAEHESFKYAIKNFNAYLKNELGRSKVDVRLNTEATLEKVQEINPDTVILASGANCFVPPIEGFDDVYLIGDAEKTAKIGEAIQRGFHTAMNI